LARTSTVSVRSATYTTTRLEPSFDGEDGVHARDALVQGSVQASREKASLLLVGAGGLCGPVARGLARKGFGRVTVLDDDVVELSNLNRQFFFHEDLYRNKALALAKNVAREATSASVIVGRALSFEQAAARQPLDADVVVCGVDNDATRVNVARHFLSSRPVVFTAVDAQADHGYVFVQEPGKACIACALPGVIGAPAGDRCTKAGAVLDILEVMAGLSLYAIDSLLMPRPRSWNYRQMRLSGFGPDAAKVIERRPDCVLCGVAAEVRDGT
jgi:adenylyltransferase/sulfurtransferase